MKRINLFILGLIMGLPFQTLLSGQENPGSFTLAVLQMKVIGGDRDSNLQHAGKMIEEAAQQGAEFILLPEAMDLGWTDPAALALAESVPMPVQGTG